MSDCPACLKLATLGTAALRWYLSELVVAVGELEQIMRAVALILSRLAENPNYSKFTSNSVSIGGGLALPPQRGTPREPGADAPAPALNGGAVLLPGLQVGPSGVLPTTECGSMSGLGAPWLSYLISSMMCYKPGVSAPAVWPQGAGSVSALQLHEPCFPPSALRSDVACLPPPASALQPLAFQASCCCAFAWHTVTSFHAVPCHRLHSCDGCRALGLSRQE